MRMHAMIFQSNVAFHDFMLLADYPSMVFQSNVAFHDFMLWYFSLMLLFMISCYDISALCWISWFRAISMLSIRVQGFLFNHCTSWFDCVETLMDNFPKFVHVVPQGGQCDEKETPMAHLAQFRALFISSSGCIVYWYWCLWFPLENK